MPGKIMFATPPILTNNTVPPLNYSTMNQYYTASYLPMSQVPYNQPALQSVYSDALARSEDIKTKRDLHQHPAYAHKRWLEIYNEIQEREDKTPTKEDLELMEEILRPSTTWCYYNELMEQEKARIEDVEARRFVVEKLTIEYR